MKHKNYWMSLLALVLILTAAVQPALAYFTANSRADGSVPLTLGSTTEIQEEVVDLTKSVTIQNTKGDPVWIRAIAYAGQSFTLEVGGDNWTGSGARTWIYYNDPVPAGSATAPLTVKVVDIPTSEEYVMTSFNVSVQYESIPVQYDENGNVIAPSASDWAHPLDAGTTSPGG